MAQVCATKKQVNEIHNISGFMSRYKPYEVRGKWTATQLTQKFVTFVLILIVGKGSG
jgi:hypothetical protein